MRLYVDSEETHYNTAFPLYLYVGTRPSLCMESHDTMIILFQESTLHHLNVNRAQ